MRYALWVIAFMLAACGGTKTPTAPPPPVPAAVSGSWTGNIESSNWQSFAVELNLTQAGSSVNGTWASGLADWNGTITGTVTPNSFSGSFTISTPNASGIGVRCTGNGSFSGSAGGTTFRWSGPGFTGSCTGLPLNVGFNVQRR